MAASIENSTSVQVRLTASASILVYTSATGGDPINLSQNYTIGVGGSLPSEVWIEGIGTGTAYLTLSATSPSNRTVSDTVRFTVVSIDSLMAKDHNSSNYVTADAPPPDGVLDLFAVEQDDHSGTVDLTLGVSPKSSDVLEHIRWELESLDSSDGLPIYDGDFSDPVSVEIPANDTDRNFIITVGLDSDCDGLLDDDEVVRVVHVNVSPRVSGHPNTAVTDQDIRDAVTELEGLDITEFELQARLAVLNAVREGVTNGSSRFEAIEPAVYPSNTWEDSHVDGIGFIRNVTSAVALSSLWDGTGENPSPTGHWHIMCDKLSKLEILRGYQNFYKNTNLNDLFNSKIEADTTIDDISKRDVAAKFTCVANEADNLTARALKDFASLGCGPATNSVFNLLTIQVQGNCEAAMCSTSALLKRMTTLAT